MEREKAQDQVGRVSTLAMIYVGVSDSGWGKSFADSWTQQGQEGGVQFDGNVI
jgi:hypothetical protein